MRLYLGTFSGAGTETNPFRPLVPGDFSILDLRGDVTQQAGRCLVAVPAVLPTVPTGWRDLGDDLDATLPALGRGRIGNDLGLTLQAVTARGIIAELLLVHGTSPLDRTRWNRLQAVRGRNRIVMLNEVIFDAPAVQGLVITDTFNRANADALGTSSEGWSWTETLGDIDIAGNLASVTTVAASAAARAESNLATANHYAQAIINNWEGGTGLDEVSPGVLVRYSTNASIEAYLGRYATHSDVYEAFRFVAGTPTLITSVGATQPTPPFTIRVEVNGSSLTIFQDGISKLATTDTNITGNLRTGIRAFQGSNHSPLVTFNNFEAGDLGVASLLPSQRLALQAASRASNF